MTLRTILVVVSLFFKIYLQHIKQHLILIQHQQSPYPLLDQLKQLDIRTAIVKQMQSEK